MDHKAFLVDLFLKQKGCDVQFTIKNSDGSSKKIGAHKLALAIASDYFNTLFYEQQFQKNITNIDVIDIGEDAFTMLLKFIYGISYENCEKVDPETMIEVYQAADQYICKEVLKYVTDLMVQQVELTSVIIFWNVAIFYDIITLKKACIEEFKRSIRWILSSSEFLEANPQTVATIFEAEHRNINSEMDFVRALERYIEHNKEFQLTSSRGIHPQLRPALKFIRFLTLTATEIAETKFLTKEEVEKIIKCLPPRADVSNMPEGFSVDRRRRNTALFKKYLYAFGYYSFSYCNYCVIHERQPTKHGLLWECDEWRSDKKAILKQIYDKYGHSIIRAHSLEDQQIIQNILEESDLLDQLRYPSVYNRSNVT